MDPVLQHSIAQLRERIEHTIVDERRAPAKTTFELLDHLLRLVEFSLIKQAQLEEDLRSLRRALLPLDPPSGR